jgi:hypothetical protein
MLLRDLMRKPLKVATVRRAADVVVCVGQGQFLLLFQWLLIQTVFED